MDNGVKIVSVSATPVDPELQAQCQETAQVMNETLNGFSDKAPYSNEKVAEAKGFLSKFTEYIKSQSFKDSVNSASQKYNVPPKKVAEGFFSKCLGTIGDVLGIAIATVGNAGHTLIDIIASLAHGAVNVIVNVATALASMVTLNRTCMA